jgi:hypothetical protein
MTNLEKQLDKKFQMLAEGCECAVCRALRVAHIENISAGHAIGDLPLPRESRSNGRAACMHHIIRRVNKILRWDWRNGLPVCQECHNRIHSEGGFNDWVEAVVIGPQKMDFLRGLSRGGYHLFLMERGWTEKEFFRRTAIMLDEQLDARVRYVCRGISEELPF